MRLVLGQLLNDYNIDCIPKIGKRKQEPNKQHFK